MMVYVAELKLTRILYTISKGESSMNDVSRRRSLFFFKSRFFLRAPCGNARQLFCNEPQLKQTNKSHQHSY